MRSKPNTMPTETLTCRAGCGVHIPVLAVVFVLAGWALQAQALPEDRNLPVSLTADRASFDQRTGISTYSGHVVLQRGSMRLDASEARVFVENGVFTRFEATGSPARFRYRARAGEPEITGSGQRVVYRASANRLTISGSAKLMQNKDEFIGDSLDYDLNKDTIDAKGPVKFLFQPDTLKQ